MEEHKKCQRIGLLDVVLNHLSYSFLRYTEMTKNGSFGE